MSTVFISYSRKDSAVATALFKDVEALGHSVWFDQELSGGQVWWDQILQQIRNCDVFVFALSPGALDSTACQREYGYAAELGKPVVPVELAGPVSPNILPPALAQIQFVDYRNQDKQAAFRLARAFNALPAPKPLPDPLPEPPLVPVSYLGSLTERVQASSALSHEEQSALLLDLRRALRDPETADDARALLERLRKRRDLLAIIADEIGELLGKAEKQTPPPLLKRLRKRRDLFSVVADEIGELLGKAEKQTPSHQRAETEQAPAPEDTARTASETVKQPNQVKTQRAASGFGKRARAFVGLLIIIALHAAVGGLLVVIAEDISYYYSYKDSAGVSHWYWRQRDEYLITALGGWGVAFVASGWFWNTIRRARKGLDKPMRRFRFVFGDGISPKTALVIVTLVVLSFHIGVGAVVFDEWSRVW